MVRSKAWECVALAAILALAACGQSRNKRRQTEMRIVLSSTVIYDGAALNDRRNSTDEGISAAGDSRTHPEGSRRITVRSKLTSGAPVRWREQLECD
jgi:hypothetical protein